jgi:OPT family small oligopeptide transporter
MKSEIEISEELDDHQEKSGVVVSSYNDIANQIDQHLLEELCPNGEYDYFLDKVADMSDEEALQIVTESIEFFSDDWNFPVTMMDQMKRLVEGPKVYGEFYERDLRINACLIKYHSPYPEVRSIADPTDDPDIPCETMRAYFLGLFWAILGTCNNTFFNSRFPGIGVGSSVIQILLFPCGKLFEKVLPDWGFSIRGTRYSLNPGVWTYKEQMFATITFNVAIYTTNCYTMILVQKSPLFYGNEWVNAGYQVMLTLFVQLIGMSFAGMLRRFTVYPVKAIWPFILPTVAMNRALLRPEKKETIHGWTMSRYKFFYTAFVCMFLYYWLPGYLFTALSNFNWMTWIAPHNKTLAVVTGASSGLGFNPWPTFDWNFATSSYAALSTPFFSVAQMSLGSLIGGFIILGMYYQNRHWTAYLPINSSSAFANDGTVYDVKKVIVNNKIDETLYQQYSPPFYSAGGLLTVCSNFVFYPVYFSYVMFNQWRTVRDGFVNFYHGLTKGRGNYENAMDVHSRLMAKYPEVPDWWFLLILLICIVLAIVFVEIFPVDSPVWLIFLLLAFNILFMIPLSILTATTGTDFGLNNLLQIVTGFALPNNPQAFLFSQTLGGWAIAGHGDNYVQDQKMAHYCKIPPRAVFRSQISAVFITCFVAVGIQDWILTHVKGLCTPDQIDHFTCAGDGAPLYASSLLWGLLGSKRVMTGLYPILKWCWLIGFVLSIVFIGGQWLGARYGPLLTARWRRTLKPKTYEILDMTVIRVGNWLLWANPVLLVSGCQHWAPSNMAYKIPGVYLSFTFMYFIKKRYTAWFEKYNYVLSAALSAGVACCALIIFFALDYNPTKNSRLQWWGNSVSGAGADGAGNPRLAIPEIGYFGPAKGSFP